MFDCIDNHYYDRQTLGLCVNLVSKAIALHWTDMNYLDPYLTFYVSIHCICSSFLPFSQSSYRFELHIKWRTKKVISRNFCFEKCLNHFSSFSVDRCVVFVDFLHICTRMLQTVINFKWNSISPVEHDRNYVFYKPNAQILKNRKKQWLIVITFDSLRFFLLLLVKTLLSCN